MSATTPETLLEHEDFVRGLAVNLLGGDADDVVQEGYAAALAGPPSRNPRAWLGTVVRNFARRRARGEARRARREAAVARPIAAPSAAEVREREAVRRRVVAAVLALDEPYREVVLLRYYEARPPREIARRLGVPVETVRTRLKRAHAVLRARLDAEHDGDRRRWALLLLPLARGARRPGAAAALATGWIAMSLTLKISLAAVVAAAAVVTLFAVSRPETGVPPSPRDEAESVAVNRASPAGPEPLPTPTEAPDVAVGGLVVDARGAPVTGAEVTALRTPAYRAGGYTNLAEAFAALGAEPAVAGRARSGEYGRFDLSVPSEAPVVLLARAGDRGMATESGLDLSRGAAGVVLRLGPAFAIEGVVLDEAGEPVAGARVRPLVVSRLQDPRTLLPLGLSATTDAAGRFRMAGLGAGDYWLVVESADRVPAVASASAPGGPVRVTVERAVPLRGTVVEAGSGRPVGDAVVTFEAPTRRGRQRAVPVATTTDAEGGFAFPAVPESGYFELNVRSDRGVRLLMLRGAPEEHLRIPLEPGVPVRGRVVRETEDGAAGGVPGVRLLAKGSAGWFGLVSGEDGRFVTPSGTRGSLVVRVDPHDPRWVGGVGAAGRGRRGIEIRVRPRGMIEGRVLGPSGGPVAGAEVSLVTRRGTPLADERALTAEDGSFRLPGPVGDGRQPARILAVKDGRAPAWTEDPPPVEIRLETGAWLRGRVEDARGRPVARARVTVRAAVGPEPVGWTGDDGRFSVDGLRPDPVTIEIGKDGFLPQVLRARPIGLPGTDLGPIVLDEGRMLGARVTDEAGRGIEGAVVSLTAVGGRRGVVTATTGPDGRWTASGVADGPIYLTVEAAGYVTEWRRPPAEIRDVVLRRGGRIRGTVTDAEGAPLPWVTVMAEWRGNGKAVVSGRQRQQTDGAGVFLFEGMTPGEYELFATSTAHLFESVEEVHPGDDPVRIVALRTRSIEGRVTDPGGRPLEGVEVTAIPPKEVGGAAGCDREVGITDGDGRFRIAPLPGDVADVVVDLADYAAFRASAVSTDARELEIRLAEGLAIRGTIRFEGGRSPEGTFVSAVPRGRRGRARHARTDADGRFEFLHLAPGRYRLSADQWPGASEEPVVEAGESGVAILVRETDSPWK